MTHPHGGFYAALDADSEGEEGKFYTWSLAEVQAILGDKAPLFCEYYDVTEEGNWEEQNILRVRKPLAQFAADKGIDEPALETLLQDCSRQLLALRGTRIRPGLDDKILLGWNALMIHACCKAYAALREDHYLHMAVRAMDCCWLNMQQPGQDGTFYHTYKEDTPKYPAFLDDYAYLIRALIALQEVTGHLHWLQRAKQLTEMVINHFSDEAGSYFYYTMQHQHDVIVRKKEIYDGAVPSGNALMANNLWYLSVVFDDRGWAARSTDMLARLAQTVVRYPTSFGIWAAGILQMVKGTREIAIVGDEYRARMQEVHDHYLPFKVLLGARKDQPGLPLLEHRESPGQTLVYVCEDYHCIKPVFYIQEIINLIK